MGGRPAGLPGRVSVRTGGNAFPSLLSPRSTEIGALQTLTGASRETARPVSRPAASLAPMAGVARIFTLPNLLSLLVPLVGLFGCSASQPPAPAKPLYTPPAEV